MIYGIVGGQGGGKSILLSRIIIQDLLDGHKVFSNMAVTPKDKSLLKNFVSLTDSNQLLTSDLSHSTVVIDEANLWGLDSRKAGKKENIELTTELCQQIRKQHIKFYYSTQRLGKVDKRLREETDILLKCEKHIIREGKLIRVIDSVWFSKDIKIFVKVDALYIDINKCVTFVFEANKLYDLYDTGQVQKNQYAGNKR